MPPGVDGARDPHLFDEVRSFWNRAAAGWHEQAGREGDVNHRHVSGPTLWRFLGDVRGKHVLDAGCGTGYLARLLHERGARVIGVDFSARMEEIARAQAPDVEFRLDDVTGLRTIEDASFDVVLSHYVLMDTPDLPGAVRAFHRVLCPGGTAVLVFSPPCFPQGTATLGPGDVLSYRWEFPSFEARRLADPPWGRFTEPFQWFHRPLSDYWRAFRDAGFAVEELEEPRTGTEAPPGLERNRTFLKGRVRPYSIAFRLRKPAT